jgi:hypothetical protein
VSITNMALFAQKERQKMARMVEQERERDQLRRSAERRGQQGHAVPETRHQPPPPTLEAAAVADPTAAVGEAAASDTAQDVSESQEDKTKREDTTKVAECPDQRVSDDAADVGGEEEEDVEEKHRARVRNELIETEINYIHNLQILDAVRPYLIFHLCRRVFPSIDASRASCCASRAGPACGERSASGQKCHTQHSVRLPLSPHDDH